MATLKYKNGDKWEEIKTQTESTVIRSEAWPVGSFYFAYGGNTYNSFSSPATLFGGNWNQVFSGTSTRYFLSNYYDYRYGVVVTDVSGSGYGVTAYYPSIVVIYKRIS